MKTLTDYINEHCTGPLFEAYTKDDEYIVKELSKFGLYLIGGTAIDFWCTKLQIPKTRSRSNNDLDFYTAASNKKNIANAIDFLKANGFDDIMESQYIIHALNKEKKIEVDILISYERLMPKLFLKMNNISVMHPVYLFSSKFDRYIYPIDKSRMKTDEIDLLQLLQIISKLNAVDFLETILLKKHYDLDAETKLLNLTSTL